MHVIRAFTKARSLLIEAPRSAEIPTSVELYSNTAAPACARLEATTWQFTTSTAPFAHDALRSSKVHWMRCAFASASNTAFRESDQ